MRGGKKQHPDGVVARERDAAHLFAIRLPSLIEQAGETLKSETVVECLMIPVSDLCDLFSVQASTTVLL